jgi:formate dehydrogenase subunit beta
MMEELRNKARALLEAGTVQVVIGYASGSTDGRVRATFARRPEQADQLVFDAHCRQNLAVYLLKPEVRALGKAAVVAHVATLRTLLQYAVENQLPDGLVIALAINDQGQLAELSTYAAIEEYLAQLPRGLSAEERQEVDKISALPLTERWAFWKSELSRCIKCYACRAACPLCYCTRCIVEVNQPQWIPVASDLFGNLEWNVVRAMHLAGRCINCGSCAAACPEHIRIDLLNHVVAQEASTQFGAEPGYSTRKDYALAAFKPDDKEEFIR